MPERGSSGPQVPDSAAKQFLNLSALAVREKAITLFLLIAIVAAGIFAFLKLGRAEDPTFTIKVFTVAAVWPGATAQEMQDLVAEPLEKRMQELRDYDRVETFTRPGLALMMVSLKDTTRPEDVPEEFYQARKKLGDEAQALPQGVFGPFINDEYSDVTFALYSVEAPDLPPRQVAREAETLRQRMLHVPGVKKVDIVGERPERIFVEFSYERLATLGVNARDVFDALVRENAVTPSGSIDTNAQQVHIRLDGALDDLQKIRDTAVVSGGRTLKLSDIADVKRGYEDPATFLVRHNGQPSLLLSIVMKEGWNGLDLGKALVAEQKKISASLPAGISFSKVTDQAVNIREAVDEFMLKFFVALAVVMLVSILSLGWRVGIVVAAAVPLTLAAVFVIMLLTGRVFDRITLGALILGLGLLVDDAIISIEIMVVKMEEGWGRIRAAGYAWSHTAAPMLAGTLVTVICLMPVGFARSTAGEYAGNIFWVVGFALLTSWVVAVTFTPYLGVQLLPEIKALSGGHEAIYATPGYEKLRRLISWAVRRKVLVACTVLGLFLVAVAGMGLVKKQFFPQSDRPELLVEVTLPQGTSIEATNASAKKVEEWLRPQPEAKIVTAYIGAGAPRFFFSYNPELPNPNFAKIILLTGAPLTQVREDIRTAEVIARSAGTDRLDPSKLNEMTLMNHWGKAVPLSQVGRIEIRSEEPILKRRDRVPTITVESDIDESLQPPQVSAELEKAIQPIVASLPEGYRIETGGNIEESGKANRALSVVFPAMIVLMLTVIIFQVRSFSAMFMVVLTAPLSLAGVVPTLLLFHQPFGFNAILGLIALAGILMRNTLILIGQIKTNQEEGLDSHHAVVEATVQRSRPVILTALAAVLAFIPLTFSVFWGSMAYTLIGGTAVGTVLTLIFLPALYSIWFGVKPAAVPSDEAEAALRP